MVPELHLFSIFCIGLISLHCSGRFLRDDVITCSLCSAQYILDLLVNHVFNALIFTYSILNK